MKMKHFFLTALFCISTLAQLSAIDSQGLHNKRGVTVSNQEKDIAEAIQHLGKALALARSIKDPEVRNAVSGPIDFSLDVLEKLFFAKQYPKVLDEATILYENIDEILSECTDEKLKDEIIDNITAMMEALERQ